MDKKKISITRIKPEITQCRLIQLEKEEKEKAFKTKDIKNGNEHEQK